MSYLCYSGVYNIYKGQAMVYSSVNEKRGAWNRVHLVPLVLLSATLCDDDVRHLHTLLLLLLLLHEKHKTLSHKNGVCINKKTLCTYNRHVERKPEEEKLPFFLWDDTVGGMMRSECQWQDG